MRKGLGLSLAVLVTACGCDAWGRGVEVFTSAEGRYQVKFPDEVTERKLETPAGELHIAETEVKSGACIVAWIDLKREENEQPSRGRERLEKARNAILDRLGAKAPPKEEVKLRNHPGLAFSASIKDGAGRVQGRVFLVKDRLYEVLILGTKDWVEKEADGFLRSFDLLP